MKILKYLAVIILIYSNISGLPHFTNITSSAGLSDATSSKDASFIDIDGDGDLDLFVSNRGERCKVYENDGSCHFVEITSSTDITVNDVRGAVWGDYNNDGDPDLLAIQCADGRNHLLSNDGDGTFTDITLSAGLDYSGNSATGMWGDINNDGWLDIFIVNYDDDEHNLLYRNNGDSTFSDITTEAGLAEYEYKGNSARLCHINRKDCDLDLYWTSYADSNRMFMNARGGEFIETTSTSGVEGILSGGNNTCIFFDYDNDGLQDLYTAYGYHDSNIFWVNQGHFSFRDATDEMGLGDAGYAMGLVAADFNHSGYMDLLVGNREYANPVLFCNDSAESFYDSTTSTGLTNPENSRGFAIADLEDDGDWDVFIANATGTNKLFRNDQDDSNYIAVRLSGSSDNKLGLGAQIYLYKDSTLKGSRQMFTGNAGGRGSTKPPEVIFGVESGELYSVTVHFQSGTIVSEDSITPGTKMVIHEAGSSSISEKRDVPKKLKFRCFPNPFHNDLKVKLKNQFVRKNYNIKCNIYDVRGKRVQNSLSRQTKDLFVWKARTEKGEILPSGIYYLELSLQTPTHHYSRVKKVLLVR